MSGTTRSSADLDVRRRQILYRSWHRGMREMDLIMGRFADAEIGELSEEDLAEFERLIEVTGPGSARLDHRRDRNAAELRHAPVPAPQGVPHAHLADPQLTPPCHPRRP